MTDFTTQPVKYASFNTRVIASVLDIGLILLCIQPLMDFITPHLFGPVDMQHIYSVVNAPGRTTMDLWRLFVHEQGIQRALTINLIQVFFIALYVIPFWFYYSTTPGKMVTRTEIRDATTGEPMTRSQCIARFLGYLVSGIPFTLGFLWVMTNKKRQGWHDYMANTVVVVKPRKRQEAARDDSASPVRPSANR